MSGGRIVKIVLSLVVLAVVLGYKFYNRSDVSDATFEQMTEVVHSLPSYTANASLLDGWAKIAHDAAFSSAYSLGGRRRASKFDADKYVQEFFKSMEEQAHMRGKLDIERELQEVHAAIDAHANG